MSIRKIPEYLRFSHKDLVESDYAPESIINLLENSVTAHLSIVVGGQPHAGKTELVKYLSTKFRIMRRQEYMRIIRRYIIERLILIKNVLNFLWMTRLHTRIS